MTTANPDYLRIQRLIETRLGLDLTARTRLQLPTIIAQFAPLSVQEVHARLRAETTTGPLWQQLIQELTIGETYFFRNQAQFQLLQQVVLPAIAQAQRRLTIWCVGCATGEEAYSVAMTALESLPLTVQARLNIVGTDINGAALSIARHATYRDWSFRHGDATLKSRYFDPTERGYRLKGHIRQMVTFQQASVLDIQAPGWADVILCRNVLLYFHEAAKLQAESVLYNALQTDGWLLLGHAEAIVSERSRWTTHLYNGAVLYQKHDPAAPPPEAEQFRYHKPQKTAPITLTGGPRIAENYTEAVAAFHAEEHDRAEQILAGILTHSPADARARVLLAAVFANRGARPEAHAQLDAAVQLQPMLADAHYLRAMLHLEVEDVGRAEDALRAALYSKRGHPLAAYLLGTLRARTGDIKRAHNLWIQALHQAEAMRPTAPISDLNPRTAAAFAALIRQQLGDI